MLFSTFIETRNINRKDDGLLDKNILANGMDGYESAHEGAGWPMSTPAAT